MQKVDPDFLHLHMLNTRHKKSLLHPFTKLCFSILSPEIQAVLESKGEYQYMIKGFAVAFGPCLKWTLNIIESQISSLTATAFQCPFYVFHPQSRFFRHGPRWATLRSETISNRRDRQKDGIWWNLGWPIYANRWSSHRVGFKPQEPWGTCSFQILCCPKIQWIYLSNYLSI